MLKDFNKLETFLTVVKEKSFSKASAKLGVSQPAVTQQIKYLEDYLDIKIVDRKKSGIRLTKEGEQLLYIAQKLERAIVQAEKDMFKIIKKEMVFVMAASNTVGNYILPNCLNEIKDVIKNDINVNVLNSEQCLEDVIEKKADIALVESLTNKDGLMYREWMEDELVLISNQPLPKMVKKEDLTSFSWICRDENSGTRKLIREVFEDIGVDCNNLDVKSVVNSSTTVLNTILKSPKSEKPTVSIISRHVIVDDVEAGRIFEARIRNYKIKRKLYISYLKERKHDAFIENVVDYLMGLNK